MTWQELAAALVAPWEGCAKRVRGLVYPYLDTLAKPPRPTRGYGRTFGITMDSPPISEDEAKRELAAGMDVYGRKVAKLSPGLLHKPQCLASCTSWAWNCGLGAYRHSRLRRAINEERWGDALDLMRKPNTAGGKVYRGLTRRREAERLVFLKGLMQD